MITEKAPAKINLALDVLEKREDNYHNLHMVMTTIDLYDRITFEKINQNEIILNSNKPFLPNDERNLVYKTVHLMKEEFNINYGLKVYINKNIPVSAGLGGGSSDAAATIRALNKLFKLNLTMDEKMEIAAKIGSDVPFCVYNKTAMAKGRGEIITALPKVPKCWVLLIKPHFGVSTKDVFENISMDEIIHPDVEAVISAIKQQDYRELCQSIGNSLEEITFILYPEVKEIKRKLSLLSVDATLMSGSGPTVFAFVKTEHKAKKVLHSLDLNKYELHAVRILG